MNDILTITADIIVTIGLIKLYKTARKASIKKNYTWRGRTPGERHTVLTLPFTILLEQLTFLMSYLLIRDNGLHIGIIIVFMPLLMIGISLRLRAHKGIILIDIK